MSDLRGEVLEAGVVTGRNFQHYHQSVELTGVDLSDVMLKKKLPRSQRKLACIAHLTPKSRWAMQASRLVSTHKTISQLD